MWLLLTLLACVCFASGAALQKHGMATDFPTLSLGRLRRELGAILRTILRNWRWLLGLLLNLVGGVFFLLAIDQGEVSVVQPLVNANLLLAVLIGVIFLGERLRATEWLGALAMGAGAVLVTLSAQSELPVASAHADAWGWGLTLLGYGLTALLLALGPRLRLSPEIRYALSAGLLFGLNTVHVKLVSLHLASAHAGLDPGLTALAFTALSDPAAWALIPDNVGGFVFFQLAFANGRVAVVSPVTNIAAMTLPVVAGVVAFGEPVGGLRLAGILVVAVGVAALVAPQKR